VVLVEYLNELVFSLAVNGAAADPREISVLDGTGGRIGIEPQEIHGAIVRHNLDPELPRPPLALIAGASRAARIAIHRPTGCILKIEARQIAPPKKTYDSTLYDSCCFKPRFWRKTPIRFL